MTLIKRYFSVEGQDPLDSVQWGRRRVGDRDVEVPVSWSAASAGVVAGKFMRSVKPVGSPAYHEDSARQVLTRVPRTIARWGLLSGLLTPLEAVVLGDELTALCANQAMAFNSPVWFNVGTTGGEPRTEQCSACFINGIDDTMEDILDLGVREGRIYKHGSGSGVNYSPLRSSRERLSTTGTASGPAPFIAKDDANAGAIKSGGTTRRAAKMVILNADHGDILEFVVLKQLAEKMAKTLIAAGFDADFRSRFGVYGMLPFQNGNHSVRVTDEFMRAVADDGPWQLLARDGKLLQTIGARDLWNLICVAAWECGCPGLQFDTTINRWHTCPRSGRIDASNPCSEYMFLNDSACNLASLNLRKFQLPDGSFDVDRLEAAVDVTIAAQEIVVGGSSYPTPLIDRNSHRFRPLGLGYANLGSALMCAGLAYDSDAGRDMAANLTSLMGGAAYRRSARLAERVGAFEGFHENKEAMCDVVKQHQLMANALLRQKSRDPRFQHLAGRAAASWGQAVAEGQVHGYRNSQVTVLAPTGTISFLMGCDTTGIEPDIALSRDKHMVGGSTIRMISEQVLTAMRNLGYDADTAQRAMVAVEQTGSVAGIVRREHLPVFDCAMPDPVTGRCVSPEGHVDMMAVTQPFLSGAISKTVNAPADCTPQYVSDLYTRAWRGGVKAIAIYRDGCKGSQPVVAKAQTSSVAKVAPEAAKAAPEVPAVPVRRPMPDDVPSMKHKVAIGDVKLHIHVGFRPDGEGAGEIGEVYICAATHGTIVNGLLSGFGKLLSVALQFGVPLKHLVGEFRNIRFEPSGWTGKQNIPQTTSILDYLFRYLEGMQLKPTASAAEAPPPQATEPVKSPGEPCPACGATTIRTGSCRSCPQCFWNGGCG